MLAFLLFACTSPDGDSPGPRASCGLGDLRDDAGACVPEACGAGEYGAVASADVHLHPGDDVAAAIQALGSGVVALAAGTYDAPLTFEPEDDDITLVGRCRELVTLDTSRAGAGTPGIVISSRAAHSFAFSDLTVTAAPYIGLWVDAGNVSLTRVDIVANNVVGLSVNRVAAVTVDDVRVADTIPGRNGPGHGIELGEGARLEGADLVVNNNGALGITGAKATVVLERMTVSDTQAAADGQYGYGASFYGGADVTLTDSAFVDNMTGGIVLEEAGTSAVLKDVTISGTRWTEEVGQSVALFIRDGAAASGTGIHLYENSQHGILASAGTLDVSDVVVEAGGYAENVDAIALAAADGATVTARGVRIANNGGIGLAAGQASRLDVDGCDVRDLRSTRNSAPGRGTEFNAGSIVNLSNCTFSRTSEIGLYAYGVGTEVALEGVTIIEPQPRPLDGVGGMGVQVMDGARVTAHDLTIRGARAYALASSGAGTEVVIEGLTVTHITPDSADLGGVGLISEDGAVLDVRSAMLSDLQRFGLQASGAGVLRLSDAVVTRVRADVDVNSGGGGFFTTGAQVDLRRVAFRDVVGGGLFASDAGTVLSAEDVRIAGVRVSPYGAGSGVEAGGGAKLNFVRVDVSGAAGAAIAIMGEGTTATLNACTVRDISPQAARLGKNCE